MAAPTRASSRRNVNSAFCCRPESRKPLQKADYDRDYVATNFKRGNTSEQEEFLKYFDWCVKEYEAVGGELEVLADSCQGEMGQHFKDYLCQKYLSNRVMDRWDKLVRSWREAYANRNLTAEEQESGIWKEKEPDVHTTRRQSFLYPMMALIQMGRVVCGKVLLDRLVAVNGGWWWPPAATPLNTTDTDFVAGLNHTGTVPGAAEEPSDYYKAMGLGQMVFTLALFLPFFLHLQAQIRDGMRNYSKINSDRLAALVCMPMAMNYMIGKTPTTQEATCYRKAMEAWARLQSAAVQSDIKVKSWAIQRERFWYPGNLFFACFSSIFQAGIYKPGHPFWTASFQLASGVLGFGQGYHDDRQGYFEHVSASQKRVAHEKALLAAGQRHALGREDRELHYKPLRPELLGLVSDHEDFIHRSDDSDSDDETSSVKVDFDGSDSQEDPSDDDTTVSTASESDSEDGTSSARLAFDRRESDPSSTYNGMYIAHHERERRAQMRREYAGGWGRRVRGWITMTASLASFCFGALQFFGYKSPPAAFAFSIANSGFSALYYLFTFGKMYLRGEDKSRRKVHNLEAWYMRLRFDQDKLRQAIVNDKTVLIPDYMRILEPGWDRKPKARQLKKNSFLMLHLATEEILGAKRKLEQLEINDGGKSRCRRPDEVAAEMMKLPVMDWLQRTGRVQGLELESLLVSTFGEAPRFQYDFLKCELAKLLKIELFLGIDRQERRPPPELLVAAKLESVFGYKGGLQIKKSDRRIRALQKGYIPRRYGEMFQREFEKKNAGPMWTASAPHQTLMSGSIREEDFILAVNSVAAQLKKRGYAPDYWKPADFQFAQLVELARFGANFRQKALEYLASGEFRGLLEQKFKQAIGYMPDSGRPALEEFSRLVADYARVPLGKRSEQRKLLFQLSENRIMTLLMDPEKQVEVLVREEGDFPRTAAQYENAYLNHGLFHLVERMRSVNDRQRPALPEAARLERADGNSGSEEDEDSSSSTSDYQGYEAEGSYGSVDTTGNDEDNRLQRSSPGTRHGSSSRSSSDDSSTESYSQSQSQSQSYGRQYSGRRRDAAPRTGKGKAATVTTRVPGVVRSQVDTQSILDMSSSSDSESESDAEKA